MALGTDFAGVEDIGPTLAQVSGRAALAQALLRRLMTPNGSLFYAKFDPKAAEYGYDLRQHLNDMDPPVGAITFRVETECLKDQRVEDARAVVRLEGEDLFVDLTITDALGPFELVVGVAAFGTFLVAQAAGG